MTVVAFLLLNPLKSLQRFACFAVRPTFNSASLAPNITRIRLDAPILDIYFNPDVEPLCPAPLGPTF